MHTKRGGRCLPQLLSLGIIMGGLPALTVPAIAQEAGNFYQGKTVEMIISTGAGGITDINARIVAQYLKKYLPGNPLIVPKNMPGAGHLRAANYIYNNAPNDGTTICAIISTFVLSQFQGASGIQFDASKFQWLGSTDTSNSTVYVWYKSGITSFEDLQSREVIAGATGSGGGSVIYPRVLNRVFGTKFKIISGYNSSPEVMLAMERGEVEARAAQTFASLRAEKPEWLQEKKILILAQGGLEVDPEYPDVPMLNDFVKTDEQRQLLQLLLADTVMGRPFFTAPGVPPGRVKLLRDAFDKTVADPAFIKAAHDAGADVRPISGVKLQEIVEKIFSTSPEVIAEFRKTSEF